MLPNAEVSPSLLSEFLATEYRVVIGDRTLVVMIGAANAELDRALDHEPWHLISAHNPDARLLDAPANQQRHRQLLARIRSKGIDSWPTVNLSSGGDWPDEPGRLLAGAAPEWVHARAHEFGQVAVVAGQPGQPARLWVYRPERLPGTHPHLIRIDS